MIRNSLLFSILALIPSSGCFALGPSIGVDANHRRAAGFLDVDAMIASDDPTLPFGLTTRMRAGVTLFDLGLGLVGCKTTAFTSFGLCGRVMLLEVGTFEGVTLDTSKSNQMSVATNVARSQLQVTVPNLSIASIRHASDGCVVTSGPGTVLHSQVTLDLPDKADADLTANVNIHSIDWSGLTLDSDAMTAQIPKLLISRVALAAIQASVDPQVVAKATVAPAFARAAMVTQMTTILIPYLNQVSLLMGPLVQAAARAAENPEVALREAFELKGVDALDVGVSIREIALPGGVSVTSRTSDGASSTTDIESLHIQDLEVAFLQVDRLDALKNEAYNLSAQLGPLDPLDQRRLDSVHEQIDELTPKADRRLVLENQAQTRSLTQAETTELTLLKRDLSAGMLQVTMASLDVNGISMDGTAVDDVTVKDLDVSALGSGLAVRMQDTPTPQEADDARRTSLQALIGREAGTPILPAPADSNAPLWSLPETMEDMGFSGSAGRVEAGGVTTAYGDTDYAAASSIDFRGNADVMGVQAADMQADGLDAMGLTADHLRGSNADIRISGNDIGGIVEQASGEGIHYSGSGMTADMETGQAGAIRFDADAATKRLRTGSIDQGSATGLDYEDAGQHVEAASASARTIEARGATASGIESLTVARGEAADGSYRRHAAPERVGEDGETIEAVTGLDAAFDAAQIADLRVTDATKAGTGTVDLASLEAQGVSGGVDGMGTGRAEMVSLSTIHASRDSNGELNASIDEAMAGGLDGQIPGTATADATILELQGIRASGDADGNYTANADLGHIFDVDANVVGRGEGSVDRIDLTDLRGEMNADGSMGGSADVVATDLDGSATGYGEGAADQLTLQRAGGRMNADGTAVVDTEGGSVTNLTGTYAEDLQDPTATGGVDEIGFGYAGLALDADRNVTGAEVNDLTGAGISVELLKLPLDEVEEAAASPAWVDKTLAHLRGEETTEAMSLADYRVGSSMAPEEAEEQDLFNAEALGGMSGSVTLAIPTTPKGMLSIQAQASDGNLDLRSITMRWLPTDGLSLGIPVTFRVTAGRGLVVKLPGVRLMIALDDRDYAGLESGRESNSQPRRGTVLIEHFVEGVMNGVTTPLHDDPELAALQTRRRDARDDSDADDLATERRQLASQTRRDRRRVARGREPRHEPAREYDDSIQGGIDYAVDTAMTEIDLPILKPIPIGLHLDETQVQTSLTLGQGELGYSSMSVMLTDEEGPSFTMSGTLNGALTATTQQFDASSATMTSLAGEPLEMHELGLRGVEVTTYTPISTDRTVDLNIADGSLSSVVWGLGAPNASD